MFCVFVFLTGMVYPTEAVYFPRETYRVYLTSYIPLNIHLWYHGVFVDLAQSSLLMIQRNFKAIITKFSYPIRNRCHMNQFPTLILAEWYQQHFVPMSKHHKYYTFYIKGLPTS